MTSLRLFQAARLKAVFPARPRDTERLDKAALALGDIDGFPVRTAECQVGRLPRAQRDFALDRPVGAQHQNGALENTRDIDPAIDIGAQAIDAGIVKFLD